MRAYHTPVLADEVVQLLDPRPGDVVVDGTAGGGGHARLLGERVGIGGTLALIDKDPSALEAAREAVSSIQARKEFVHGDFRRLAAHLDDVGIGKVDAVLLDLGVSSRQLDETERGFSFRLDAPLDMRMDPTNGETAAELIARLDKEEIARIIKEFGEDRWSARIAEFIVRERGRLPVVMTGQLADIVKAAIPKGAWPKETHPATRTFQALRIAVNDEIGALQKAVEQGIERLNAGGRIAVIAYHSLEDRVVKQAFLRLSGRCQCPPGLPECRCSARPVVNILTRKPVVPQPTEVAMNPRARSAKLRAAERL